MADHSVGARDELHKGDVSQFLMFCFGTAYLRKILLRRRSVLFYALSFELLCFCMQREKMEIFDHSALRENSGSIRPRGPAVCLLRFLCGVWWRSNTIFRASTFPKLKKAALERHPQYQKKKKLFMSLPTRGMTPSKYYGVITKRMNFDCHVSEISGILSHITTTWSYMRLLSTF